MNILGEGKPEPSEVYFILLWWDGSFAAFSCRPDVVPSWAANIMSHWGTPGQHCTGALKGLRCEPGVAGTVWCCNILTCIQFLIVCHHSYIKKRKLSSLLLKSCMYFSCRWKLDFSACFPSSEYFFGLFLCNCASCSTVIFPNWKSCWKYFSYSFKRTANQEAKKGKLLLSIPYFFKIRYFRIALDKTKKPIK